MEESGVQVRGEVKQIKEKNKHFRDQDKSDRKSRDRQRFKQCDTIEK